jgi:hypothetical protein
MDLTKALLDERLELYVRLKGGWTFPAAGAVYWAALAYAGTLFDTRDWLTVAFIASGMIFPMAWFFSRLAGINFMGEQSAVGSVIAPAFIGMLLFWPMAVLAYWTDPPLAVPILAIGMSMHWPVIGWSYARPALFSAHAIARALIVAAIWMLQPDMRLIAIPAAVAFLYVATMVAIWVDVAAVRRSLK